MNPLSKPNQRITISHNVSERLRKFSLGIFGMAIAVHATSTASAATSIGLNFSEPNGAGTWEGETINAGENTNSLDTAVGLTATNWTNVTGVSGTATIGGSINVNWGSTGNSGVWHAGSESKVGLDASNQIFRGYLDDNATSGPTITLTGISAYLASQSATSFTLTVFFSTDNANATFTTGHLTPGDGLATDFNATVSGNGSWTNGIGSTEGVRGYATISGLSGDSYNITTDHSITIGGVPSRGSIAGIAITAIPEPSSAILALVGGMMLFSRRRD